MESITLEELKKLNAENAAKETESEEVETVEAQEEIAEESNDLKAEESGEDAEETEEQEVEAWQASEEAEDSQDGKTGFVPDAGAKKLRLKAKAFRDERDQAQSEVEKLRGELEQLKKGHYQQPEPQELKRPKLEDYDFDEEAHGRALDDYYDKRAELKQSQYSQQSQQAQAIQAQKQAQEEAVNKHYQAAEQLIAKHGIDAESYSNADGLIRGTIEAVMPGQGDSVADGLIAKLVETGEGSEKVWYHLGRSAGALAELRASLKNDPSGLTTTLFLGRLSERATKPIRVKSGAPSPQKQLKGDSKVNGSSMYKKYKESKDVSERIALKRQAKKAGENVAEW